MTCAQRMLHYFVVCSAVCCSSFIFGSKCQAPISLYPPLSPSFSGSGSCLRPPRMCCVVPPRLPVVPSVASVSLCCLRMSPVSICMHAVQVRPRHAFDSAHSFFVKEMKTRRTRITLSLSMLLPEAALCATTTRGSPGPPREPSVGNRIATYV